MKQRPQNYVNSRHHRRQRMRLSPDLIVSVGTVLILSVLVRIPILLPLRVVTGLAVGLVVPGYLLVAWIFPDRATLQGWERLGIIFVVNIALIIIMGLLMALLKIPLETMTVANVLTGVVAILAGIVFWARQSVSPSVLPKKVSWRDRKPIVVLALLTAGLAGFVWYVVGTNLHTQYTAFSLTNPHNQLSGYPYLLQPHEKDPMRLDIFNPASSKQQYIVVARTPSRVLWKRSVTVAPGQHWWHIINLPTIGVGSLVHLHFMLMTTKGETIRQLWITYHVAQ